MDVLPHDLVAAALLPFLEPCATALALRAASRSTSSAFTLYAVQVEAMRLPTLGAFRDPWRTLRVLSKLVSARCGVMRRDRAFPKHCS